jgi:hypothetical protein
VFGVQASEGGAARPDGTIHGEPPTETPIAKENAMNRTGSIITIVLLGSLAALSQKTPPTTPPAKNTSDTESSSVRGCLDGQRGNYIVVENKTGTVYVLKGVGNRLDNQLGHEVEVKGHILPGTVKTGIRPEKGGSNPSDTVHGVDGVPFQVADWHSDIRVVAKKCKAADQQQ